MRPERYTGNVRAALIRCLATLLIVIFAGAQVLGAVCARECVAPADPAAPSTNCHDESARVDAPTVRKVATATCVPVVLTRPAVVERLTVLSAASDVIGSASVAESIALALPAHYRPDLHARRYDARRPPGATLPLRI